MNRVTHVWQQTTTWRGRKVTRTKRRRACRHCGTAYTTIEAVEEDLIKAVVEENLPPKKPPEAGPKPPENPYL